MPDVDEEDVVDSALWILELVFSADNWLEGLHLRVFCSLGEVSACSIRLLIVLMLGSVMAEVGVLDCLVSNIKVLLCAGVSWGEEVELGLGLVLGDGLVTGWCRGLAWGRRGRWLSLMCGWS